VERKRATRLVVDGAHLAPRPRQEPAFIATRGIARWCSLNPWLLLPPLRRGGALNSAGY